MENCCEKVINRIISGLSATYLGLPSIIHKGESSEKQSTLRTRNNIDVNILTNNLHRSQVVGRYWHHQYAVVIVVKRLHFGKVTLYLLANSHILLSNISNIYIINIQLQDNTRIIIQHSFLFQTTL